MITALEMRKLADDCRHKAFDAADVTIRKGWEALAAEWNEAAEQREHEAELLWDVTALPHRYNNRCPQS